MALIVADDSNDPQQRIYLAEQRIAAAREQQQEAITAAGGYVVDRERAAGCILAMNRIIEDLKLAMNRGRKFQVDPPGYDEVSVNAARNVTEMTRRAVAYGDAWVKQIEATRDALERQLDAYQASEKANESLRP